MSNHLQPTHPDKHLFRLAYLVGFACLAAALFLAATETNTAALAQNSTSSSAASGQTNLVAATRRATRTATSGIVPAVRSSATPTSGTQTLKQISVNGGSLSGHGCNSSEWGFVITQIDSEADAPSSIHVTWANGASEDVALSSFTGGTAHYRTSSNLDSTVTGATAEIYSSWDGTFNLSHGPCGSATPTETQTVIIGATTTPTNTPTHTSTATPTQPTNTPTHTPTPTETTVVGSGSSPTPTPTTRVGEGNTPVPSATPTEPIVTTNIQVGTTSVPTTTVAAAPTATPSQTMLLPTTGNRSANTSLLGVDTLVAMGLAFIGLGLALQIGASWRKERE